MNIAVILPVILLVGCAGIPELVSDRQVDEVSIKWVRGIERDCGSARSPQGCAASTAAGCTITMPEDASDAVVAHEYRHCFGYRHKGN